MIFAKSVFITMRIVLYNPLSIVRAYRGEQISAEFKDTTAVMLNGTRARQTANKQRYTAQYKHHWAVHWPYGRGRFTNRAAGCAVLLTNRISKDLVARVWDGPSEAQGRAGAIRVKDKRRDIVLITMYWPPPTSGKGQEKNWKPGIEVLTYWLRDVLLEVPARATVILGMDLNDGFNAPQTDEEAGVLGQYIQGFQGYAATKLLEVCAAMGLANINSYFKLGPTFYGPTGATSHIDHIFVPQSEREEIVACEVWMRSGRRIQLRPDSKCRDHLPVVIKYKYQLRVAQRQKTRQWDQDAMCRCIQTGEGRREFLEALEDKVRTEQKEITCLEEQTTPDEHWETFRNKVCEIAQKHFGRKVERTNGRKAWEKSGTCC